MFWTLKSMQQATRFVIEEFHWSLVGACVSESWLINFFFRYLFIHEKISYLRLWTTAICGRCVSCVRSPNWEYSRRLVVASRSLVIAHAETRAHTFYLLLLTESRTKMRSSRLIAYYYYVTLLLYLTVVCGITHSHSQKLKWFTWHRLPPLCN